MTFNPPTDPADRPQEGDPPVDALSMVEVIEEFGNQQQGRLKNAIKLQRLYALQALLNGESPLEVASKCGFDGRRQIEATKDPVADFAEQLGIPLQMMGIPGRNKSQPALCDFHDWLAEGIADLVHGRD